MEYIILKNFILINQPIGVFYVAKMNPYDLKKISQDNLSRYQDLEGGIQRELSKKRQKEICEYIYTNPDATFPSSFIISVSSDTLVDLEKEEIKIPLRDAEAYILDGQHRLSGFKDENKNLEFEIIVSIFIDIDRFDQAMIFATINGKQEKVNPSLVFDLFELTDERSYEKVGHDIVKLLNETETSPWYRKIKMLGKGQGDISQATMIKELIFLLKKGVLKNWYDSKGDSQIYKILENYFSSIRQIFTLEWENNDSKGKKNFILTKTTGFIAFMKLFSDLYELAQREGKNLTVDFFNSKLSGIPTNIRPLISDNYESGAKGQNKLYEDLKACINIE